MTEGESAALRAAEADRVNKRFAGVGAALGLILWGGLFWLPLGIASGMVRKSHPSFGVFLGFLAMLSVVPGTLWVAKSAWGDQWHKALPLAPVSLGLLMWTALGVLAQLPVVLAWFWTIDRTVGLPIFPDPLSSVGVLGLVLGAPLAEEVLFRGYGVARIRELGGERRALLFTSLAFALCHGSWVKWPGTLAIGLFLGWLVLRTGSLWPALMGHFINNGSAFVLGRLESVPFLESNPVSWTQIVAFVAVGVAGLALLWSPCVRRRISGLSAST
jgi:membrane protease YdiL (CAAX protease family)